MKGFGERIKHFRLKGGLSQEELANQLNVSRTTISKWECSKQTPSIFDFLSLCNCFQVTLDQLIEPSSYKQDHLHDFQLLYLTRKRESDSHDDAILKLIDKQPSLKNLLLQFSSLSPPLQKELLTDIIPLLKKLFSALQRQ
ncbi:MULTISPECIES: helix-turn-helix domain-containing protein [Priestia]|jgi:transcriptional regulator with XRE-family HTH domain|uniref:helix-turn-helix domain-containing protein n=1 Tax=Priestia TaxID=2800373 RepID=UPI00204154AE|nr:MULTISPECIES: helix-turn-helix transcriptional regulator [Priestia]MCM3773083.1 helix-turn-helix domain-containing protein [Priestia aryabhattai]MDY0941982.1 helix-turn-helix transcriptional regulator [Priestia megaterium]